MAASSTSTTSAAASGERAVAASGVEKPRCGWSSPLRGARIRRSRRDRL